MSPTPIELATVAAPIFANLMGKQDKVELDDVLETIRRRARTAISQAKILLEEAHRATPWEER